MGLPNAAARLVSGTGVVAITGEARGTSRELGASESVFEIPATLAPKIVRSQRRNWSRSQKLAVRVEAG